MSAPLHQGHPPRTRALITTAVIFVFSIGYNFVRFWEYTLSDEPGVSEDMLIVGLLRENQIYMVLYQNIAMLLTQFVLPLMVLCILNLQVGAAVGEEKRIPKNFMFFRVAIYAYSMKFCMSNN